MVGLFEAHLHRKASETSKSFHQCQKVRLWVCHCFSRFASTAVQMKMKHAGRKPPEMEGGAETVGDLNCLYCRTFVTIHSAFYNIMI